MAAKAPPSLDDLVRQLSELPSGVKGEIIKGVLYTQPRPRARHMDVEDLIVDDLESPYQRGRGGPGDWWILSEPGIELPGSPECSPDHGGWRRERLRALPDGPLTVIPDWVCEILSPATRGYDQRIKRPFYAEIGVSWSWYVDLEARTLTISRLESGRWLELAVHGEGDRARAEPFADVELDLAEWWG